METDGLHRRQPKMPEPQADDGNLQPRHHSASIQKSLTKPTLYNHRFAMLGATNVNFEGRQRGITNWGSGSNTKSNKINHKSNYQTQI